MRFYSLDKLINLYDGYRKVFKIDQHGLILLQHQGSVYLLESTCPHRGHPLTEAGVSGNELRCPLHGYRFDIGDGQLIAATEEPCRSLKTFEVVYRQTEVGLML